MDYIDRKIMDILQDDGRITMKELGQRVGLTSPATIERVKKLEEGGIIDGYKAIINMKFAGLPIRVFILIASVNSSVEDITKFSREHRNIVSCHRVSGGVSHLLEAVLPDMQGLEKLLDELVPLGQAEPLVVLSSPVEQKAVLLP
ncbi:MAG: AsnC/Lrp family transcriptional regulator [Firmicutes bacterium]|nr:AsnC/Lrp family transcriptional regulator [Bacillota bacterium]